MDEGVRDRERERISRRRREAIFCRFNYGMQACSNNFADAPRLDGILIAEVFLIERGRGWVEVF